MLATQQPVLRRFYYPVALTSQINENPLALVLLGERLVIWRSGLEKFGAVRDRCPHRTARLSEGWIENGNIRCRYHGLSFDSYGQCTNWPQSQSLDVPARCVPRYRCETRHGYVWVCLDEPLADIPDIPEAADPQFYRLHEFQEAWRCSGLRIMENAFDVAHFPFVHSRTFGLADHSWAAPTIAERPGGLHMNASVVVRNPVLQRANLRIESETTIRDIEADWYLPFGRRMRIRYPNGLVHTILTWAAPVDDQCSLVTQFVYRNDRSAPAAVDEVIKWDLLVTREDRAVLEGTDWDAPLDTDREVHLPTDRPGILMRRRLQSLLAEHGEVEAVRAPR